ncbi:chorismate-binding protein [Microlunatus speluncae]|uniref:chorismate-binding protein n=1 Tax=Microlunatus speluncae TaxID=2594267 RepID=UPI0012664FC0|nr:chorismate-binding protein [Microlunatus speluncae]
MPTGRRVLLIDNDDSYTYNLYHLIGELTGCAPTVVGSDDQLDWSGFSQVVISPGPGHPAAHPGLLTKIREADRPVLGVCLGHQLIALAFGARVGRVRPHHGLIGAVGHDGRGVFAGLPQLFPAVRYHSLAVDRLPPELELTATAEDGVIMGLRHRSRPLHGVQFHPESVAAAHGRELMINFLDLARTASTLPERPTLTFPEPVEGQGRSSIGPSPLRQAQDDASTSSGNEQALHTREVPWREPEDVFVAHYADRGPVCWLDSSRPGAGARFSYLGAPEEVLTGRYGLAEPYGLPPGGGEDVLEQVATRIAAAPVRAEVPFPFHGGFVGYLGYPDRGNGGAAEFGRLDRFFVFDHDQRRCYAATVGGTGGWLDRAETMIESTVPAGEPDRTGEVGVITEPGPDWYRSAYRRVQEHLHSGDSYEVNLTFRRRIGFRGDHAELYRRLRRINPAPHAAFLRLPSATVLSSSPERFLRIDDHGRVQARPIKGTAPRHDDPARDAAAATGLRTETKTRAENLMIADLLRHDLGLSCRLGSVRVPELMAVETHPSLHQLVSTIEGDLAPGLDAVGCVRAALPPGSMTGAPKHRTCEIIDEVEESPRGLYSGVLGYFSYSGAADLSVIIRTIEARADELIIGVGGGVIVLSDVDDEYAEALLKSAALLTAVRGSARDQAAPEPVGTGASPATSAAGRRFSGRPRQAT